MALLLVNVYTNYTVHFKTLRCSFRWKLHTLKMAELKIVTDVHKKMGCWESMFPAPHLCFHSSTVVVFSFGSAEMLIVRR